MEIVHISAELAPLAKVGGLGDVLLGLSRALHQKNERVEIILPKYDCMDLKPIENLEVFQHDLSSYFDGEWHHNTIWRGSLNGIVLTLIESHDPWGFFERKTIYGCEDDVQRFLYFSRVCLEYLLKTHRSPDILHVHDWHAAAVPVLLKNIYMGTSLRNTHTVLTIHNLAYQGLSEAKILKKAGLNEEELYHTDRLQDLHRPELINLLQGGIVYADFVTTVSPTYAKEALTPTGGKGLETILNRHGEKFAGILNGIDYEYWNPETDPHLPFHFSLEHLSKASPLFPFIEQKRALLSHLRHVLSLSDEICPLVSCVTRLVYQKGPELIKQALFKTLEMGGQFVLVGSALEESTHVQFYNLKRKLAGSRHVHIELNYNEPLSHLVYAASDLLVIPSLFEPCGLTQMIAMRYGTVPLVRETGGLSDTVFEGKNGFTFAEPTAESILHAMERALTCWEKKPDHWKALMEIGMQSDFSWNVPSEEYLKIYQKLRKSSPTFV